MSINKIAVSLLEAQKNGIKSPKIRLEKFQFSLAPSNGRNPGCIYIKNGSQYLGKIDTANKIHISHYDHDYKDSEVQEMLQEIRDCMSNPAASAKAYGFRTGNCSCCGRLLTNKLSVSLGIGPICRDKYGWIEPSLRELEEIQQYDLLESLGELEEITKITDADYYPLPTPFNVIVNDRKLRWKI